MTVQSFTYFAAMTGAITAAWHGLQKLTPQASTLWVPHCMAFAWAIISVVISIEGLKKGQNGVKKLELGTLLGAIFVAVVNSLVLAGAVVRTNAATTPAP